MIIHSGGSLFRDTDARCLFPRISLLFFSGTANQCHRDRVLACQLLGIKLRKTYVFQVLGITRIDYTRIDYTRIDYTRIDYTRIDYTRMDYTRIDYICIDCIRIDCTRFDIRFD
jgi:hypothetical protein